MAKRDRTPEERAELERMRDEALASRRQLQEAWDDLREKWRLAESAVSAVGRGSAASRVSAAPDV